MIATFYTIHADNGITEIANCESVSSPGKIYHDIGLLYSSEHCYQSASECFEHSYHALEEVHREDKDRMLEAIVLMNLGASLNHLDLYERGITFHTKAIKKFGMQFLFVCLHHEVFYKLFRVSLEVNQVGSLLHNLRRIET